MNKYLKGIAVAAMVAVVAAVTPVVGFAAGNAQVKADCMSAANDIAKMIAKVGVENTKVVLTKFGEGLEKAGGKAHVTDTELLWLMPINVTPTPTMEIKVYPAIQKVSVTTKAPGIYETAEASF